MGKIIFIPVLLFILSLSSACSPVQISSASILTDAAQVPDSASSINPAEEAGAPISSKSQSSSNPSQIPQGMAEFEGQVFVATTDLVAELWKSSGWAISDQPLDTNKQDIPEDCTLYPHSGVKNQWVGSCSGYILIPRSGAQHIAVMLTAPDGSTTMVQVAPAPDQP